MTSIWHIPMRPQPADAYPTSTSIEQLETERTLLRTLTTKPPSPPTTLNKPAHAQYLAKNLLALPAPYVSLDASRPWLMYWCLHSFDLLGIALDPDTKARAASTLLAFQSPSGGFGGGPPPTHEAHLLPTYAAVMGLAICGTKEDWDRIDRKGCYEFFMRCKRKDGGFVVSSNGEVDVRGIYCLLVVSTLLDILTPELAQGIDSFLAGCQTYEGGFASSSFRSGFETSGGEGVDVGRGMVAMAEAHGGYTSCALHSYFLLRPLRASSSTSENPSPGPQIDEDAALRWVTSMQAASIEGGGFRGRTNKLVDGCYGWWVGGLGAVLDALIRNGGEEEEGEVGILSDAGAYENVDRETAANGSSGDDEVSSPLSERRPSSGDWQDEIEDPDMFFNRFAAQEYILIAAQGEKGGLRDKPGKNPDLYHTTNNLSGLSTAQHLVRHSPSRIRNAKSQWVHSSPPEWLVASQRDAGSTETEEEREERRRGVWAEALGWVEVERGFFAVGGEVNRVNTTCPVFNILLLRVKPFIDHFYGQG